MPQWIPYALVVQLVLTLFFPGIKLGTRSVFLGDLWSFVWVAGASLCYIQHSKWNVARKFIFHESVIFGVVLVAFAHGYYRPNLHEELYHVGFGGTPIDEFHFNFTRELVVALRFGFWACGALIAGTWAPKTLLHPTLKINLLLCTLVAGLVVVASKISPGFEMFLGHVFGYDPQFGNWLGRAYGAFRSPAEAGLTLGLASLLLFVEREKSLLWLSCFSIAILGLILSRSFTPIAAWGSVPLIFFLGNPKTNWRWPALAGFAAIVASVFFLFSRSDFLSLKMGDFLFRFGAWKVFLQVGVSRWDYLLFGLGFSSFHVDNSFLFLFNRGGLLVLGLALFWMVKSISKHWKKWSWEQRSSVVFILICGLFLDCFIERPVVALMLSAAIPVLSLNGVRPNE